MIKTNQKGSNNYNWKGGKVSRTCLTCGSVFYIYKSSLNKIKKGVKGKYCSRKCYGTALSKRQTGDKHWNWRGGLSKNYTTTFEWKQIRLSIIKRDNNKCRICESEERLQVHHIVPYRITQDNSEGNLITLCLSCHNKEEWSYYKSKKGQMTFSFIKDWRRLNAKI